MKYILDISTEVDEKIRQLVKERRYKDIYQFIERAIEGLLHLEEIDVGSHPGDEIPTPATIGIKSKERKSKERKISKDWVSVEDERLEPHSDLVHRIPTDSISVADPNKPKELWGTDTPIPWLWGQINSLLAIKTCLRVLGNFIKQGPSDVLRLDTFKELLGPQAQGEFKNLRFLDNHFNLKRDEYLSKSFPRETEKSKKRFVDQYVGGFIKKNGRVYGALPELSFARLSVKDDLQFIQITKQGLKLACLKNFILDGERDALKPIVFSDDEIALYLDTIRTYCPPEAEAFETLIRLICEGHDSPQSLDAALADVKPQWSSNEVVTYKAGTLSRMKDLKLIEKESLGGVNVRYKITERAKAF